MQEGKLLAIARRAHSRAPMEEISSVEITASAGVAGDARGKPGQRQVTVLDADAWESARATVGRDIPWTVRRANLLVSGIDLANSAGGQLRVGDVLLNITCETEPCQRMEEQVAGLYVALVPDWRGGVCCQVVSGGTIALGAAVRLERPAAHTP